MTKLGTRLRELRLARDWTQEEAEERSEVPQTTISGLETGRVTRTSHETLLRLARAYGVRVRELYEVAGMIEPGEVDARVVFSDHGQAPALPPVDRIIAYVESNPAPAFHERLMRMKRLLSVVDYTRLCVKTYTAWQSNGDLGLSLAEAGAGINGGLD